MAPTNRLAAKLRRRRGDPSRREELWTDRARAAAAKGKTSAIGIFGPSTKEDFDNPLLVAMMGMQCKVESY